MMKLILSTMLMMPAAGMAMAEVPRMDFAADMAAPETCRVDPGKTLKLIKRIKDAGGSDVAL